MKTFLYSLTVAGLVVYADGSANALGEGRTLTGATNLTDLLEAGGDTNALAVLLEDLQSRLAAPDTNVRPTFVVITNRELQTGRSTPSKVPNRGVEQIQYTTTGARGDFGPHKVTFDINVNTEGAIDLTLPGGGELRSHVVGLCYYDLDDWKSVMIARMKDRWGQVLLPNQVVYRDAFDTISADVVYTYTGSSMEQDIILRKRLPAPDDFGLRGDNIYLGVVTEFLDPPLPERTVREIEVENPFAVAGEPAVLKFYDEVIRFGSMRIVEGKAFTLGNSADAIPVGKVWQEVDGRQFLVEFTPLRLIALQLAELPRQASVVPAHGLMDFKEMLAVSERPQKALENSEPMQLSQMELDAEPGVVMDYLIVNTPLMNIDFGGGAGYGRAAVGQDDDDYWNAYYYSGYTPSSLTDLYWSDYSSSSVGIVVSNVAENSYNPLCQEYMYGYFVNSTNSANLSVTITNLPSDVYDVFVYAARATEAGAPVIELQRAGTSLWKKNLTYWSERWYSPAWEEHEQFVRFRDIAVTNQHLTLISHPDSAGYATLSGIQLVPSAVVPSEEPAITNLINVNFGGSEGAKVGLAATGLTTNDYWNPHVAAYAYFISVPDLKWSDQTTSSVGMVGRNEPGTWGITMPDPMVTSYKYAYSGTDITIVLTNLPSGAYDFYLYSLNNYATNNSIFEVWSGEVDQGIKGTSIVGYGPESNHWELGQQYVRFRDVAVSSNQPVVIHSKKNAGGYNNFAGMQIVGTGEADSDSDGLPDGWELKWFNDLDETADGDPDFDGLVNLREYELSTFPTRFDSDGDGYFDLQDSDFPWVDEATPFGAYLYGDSESWSWVGSWHDGTGWGGQTVYPLNNVGKMHVSANVSGTHQHYFAHSAGVIRPGTGDVLYAYVNLDSTYPPTEVMLQWWTLEDNGYYGWEHRAYWGANSLGWGVNGTTSRYSMGTLPSTGEWVRLEVPASLVGLEGRIIEGMAFSLYGGRAAWDNAGIFKPDMDGDELPDEPVLDSDADGLEDDWEAQYFGSLAQTASGDPDSDGLTNLQEFINGTDPGEADTDGDGVSDATEVALGTDPLTADVSGVLEVFTPLNP